MNIQIEGDTMAEGRVKVAHCTLERAKRSPSPTQVLSNEASVASDDNMIGFFKSVGGQDLVQRPGPVYEEHPTTMEDSAESGRPKHVRSHSTMAKVVKSPGHPKSPGNHLKPSTAENSQEEHPSTRQRLRKPHRRKARHAAERLRHREDWSRGPSPTDK